MRGCGVSLRLSACEFWTLSFRDGPKDQTSNLESPSSGPKVRSGANGQLIHGPSLLKHGGRSITPLLAALLLHCRLVSVSIVTAPLERERVLGIDPAIGVSTARRGHALGVAGELAIARIAPYAPLQTIAIRPRRVRRKTIGLSLGWPSCQNHTYRQNCQSQSAHWNLLEAGTTLVHLCSGQY